MKKHYTFDEAMEAADKIRKGTMMWDKNVSIVDAQSLSSWRLERALKDQLHTEGAREAVRAVLNELEYCPDEGVSRDTLLEVLLRTLMCHAPNQQTHDGRVHAIQTIQNILA